MYYADEYGMDPYDYIDEPQYGDAYDQDPDGCMAAGLHGESCVIRGEKRICQECDTEVTAEQQKVMDSHDPSGDPTWDERDSWMAEDAWLDGSYEE